MAMVLPIVISISCCSSAASTPDGTVSAWIDAIADQNADAVVSYQIEDYGGKPPAFWVEWYELSFETMKSSSATNRQFVVESETDTSATVSVTFDFSWTGMDDETHVDAVNTAYVLTKVDGKWLLSEEVI